jgi:RNA polymerase primary sigma factor
VSRLALATILRPSNAAQLIPSTTHPTRREQTVLARQARRGNARSRDELILRNLRLVYAVARRYVGCGLEIDDVIQEGVAGLIRAVDKFDPERGVAFSTYAIWWIRQSIGRALDNTARLIRIPSNLGPAAAVVRKAVMESDGRAGELALDVIAQAARVDPDTCATLLQATAPPISIDAPARAESETPLNELVADRTSSDPETEAVREEVRAALHRLLSVLPARERAVVRARFGFDGIPQTLDAIAERYHLSAERIRQIEARALVQLRRAGQLIALDVLARDADLL